MKAVGQLLVVISLACGSLAAATCYHASLEAPVAELKGLTLMDDAGQLPGDPRKPLIRGGTQLTGADIQRLVDNKVKVEGQRKSIHFVRVKEFAWSRWQGRWFFVASMLGMIAGALAMRVAERPAPASQSLAAAMHPQALLREIATDLDALIEKIDATDVLQQQRLLILQNIGRLQQTRLNDFVESRTVLTSELGMGRMAEIMDEFSSAERNLNRAWTIASDGHVEEAVACVRLARELLPTV